MEKQIDPHCRIRKWTDKRSGLTVYDLGNPPPPETYSGEQCILMAEQLLGALRGGAADHIKLLICHVVFDDEIDTNARRVFFMQPSDSFAEQMGVAWPQELEYIKQKGWAIIFQNETMNLQEEIDGEENS